MPVAIIPQQCEKCGLGRAADRVPGSRPGGACGRHEKGAINKFGEDLLQGMKEACGFAEGKSSVARVQVVDAPDLGAIRWLIHMPQHEFASAFRIPLATRKNWEQRRRAPDASAAAYLQAIACQPQMISGGIAAGMTCER